MDHSTEARPASHALILQPSHRSDLHTSSYPSHPHPPLKTHLSMPNITSLFMCSYKVLQTVALQMYVEQTSIFSVSLFCWPQKVELTKLIVMSYLKIVSPTEMCIHHCELSHRMMKLPHFVFWFLWVTVSLSCERSSCSVGQTFSSICLVSSLRLTPRESLSK